MKGACPYCGQSISDAMGRIEAVGSNFASAKVGNIDKVIDALSVGSAYMNESAFEKLNSIVDSALPITDSAKGFVGKVVLDAQIIIEAIERARSVSSYFDLSGADDLDAVLDNCKIDVGFVDSFESTKCCELIGELNDAIEAAKSNSGKLKGLVNRQKAKLAKSLNERCREINSFLMTAGYPYRVEITSVDRGACSVKLVHQSSWEVEDSREALSYGERNAFALVFFAYECMRKRPDLIILDDPISSFDGAKRFALLNMLFLGGAGEASLKCKTVLLLTHDYGTLYDVARTHRHRFQPLANSSVLSCVDGRVFETFVDAGDMVRADILYNELARTSECLLTRLVYARKVLEFENDKGSNAYDVVSSLFHHRPEPLRRDGTPMDEFDISNGIDRLVFIVDKTVNYDKLLSLLECPSKMLNAFDSASSNYEKIQLARIATQAKVGDTVIKDRMDDSVHIGNGYLYQLNPLKFELVPHHLVVRCREELQAIASVC